MSATLVSQAIRILNSLPDAERLEVMQHYCRSCGADNPGCQCWNDE